MATAVSCLLSWQRSSSKGRDKVILEAAVTSGTALQQDLLAEFPTSSLSNHICGHRMPNALSQHFPVGC